MKLGIKGSAAPTLLDRIIAFQAFSLHVGNSTDPRPPCCEEAQDPTQTYMDGRMTWKGMPGQPQ